MGATNFTDMAFGRNAIEAFNNAVDQAVHQYGVDPYSGTIATQHGYVLFHIKPGRRITPEQVDVLCGEADEAYWNDKARSAKGEQALQRLGEVMVSTNDLTIPTLVDVGTGDKWGPCACIEYPPAQAKRLKAMCGRAGSRQRPFYFFGMAPT